MVVVCSWKNVAVEKEGGRGIYVPAASGESHAASAISGSHDSPGDATWLHAPMSADEKHR